MKTTYHKKNRGVSSSFRRQMAINSQIINNSHKNYPREDYRRKLYHEENSNLLYLTDEFKNKIKIIRAKLPSFPNQVKEMQVSKVTIPAQPAAAQCNFPSFMTPIISI